MILFLINLEWKSLLARYPNKNICSTKYLKKYGICGNIISKISEREVLVWIIKKENGMYGLVD